MPKVSIIMPTLNGYRYINQAIGSVFEQSYEDWELIIVDDGSSPEIESIIKKEYINDPRVRIVRNESNLGIQRTLNRGVELSRGDYIARIDDDDWWNERSKLKRQVDLLNKQTNVGLCGTGTIVSGENGKELFRYKTGKTDRGIRSKILMKNPFTHSSVIFRKDLFLELGGYREGLDMRHLEDYDLWLRIGQRARFANLDSYSTSVRLHNLSISSSNKKQQLRKIINLVKEYGGSYPGRRRSLIWARTRLILYRGYAFLPEDIKKAIFAIYKKF